MGKENPIQMNRGPAQGLLKQAIIENFQDYASRIMKRAIYTDYMNLGKKNNLMNPSQNFRPLGIFTHPSIEKSVSTGIPRLTRFLWQTENHVT